MCDRCVKQAQANLFNAQAVSHLTDSYVRLMENGATALAKQTADTISEMLPVKASPALDKGLEQTDDQVPDPVSDMARVMAELFGVHPNDIKIVKVPK